MSNASDLSLDRAIDRHPLTVYPDTPISVAIALMSQTQSSYVLVVEMRLIRGNPLPFFLSIFTETDVLKTTFERKNLAGLTMAEVINHQSIALTETQISDVAIAIKLLRQHRVSHLPIVDGEGFLIGIVTQTSLLRSLKPLAMGAKIDTLQQLVQERTLELQQANEQLQSEVKQHRQTAAALQQSQANLAGILDIADDAIISVDINQRIQLFNKGAERIFGYTAAEALGQPLEILLPQTLRPVHCQHIQKFSQSDAIARKMGERREIVGLHKDGTQFPAEASISNLKLGQEIILTVILRDITERKQAEEALRNQIARERLMTAIAARIRQSLDLDRILSTTVAEVRQFLGCDRVIVYRFSPDWSGVIAVESVSSHWKPILGSFIKDHCFVEDYVQLYENGRITAIDDLYNGETPQCHIDLLAPYQVRANLVVPIVTATPTAPEVAAAEELGAKVAYTHLWGLLSAHQCSASRHWQVWEIEFLKQLATQVAIAIQQAELYQQLVTANQQLQQLVSLDGLTHVANRRRFDEYLDKEWMRMLREKKSLSLILCDVDCFKPYNDTYGHLAGDSCLQQIAAAIRAAVKRATDLVARYGGEEFAVILPNTTTEGAAKVAVEIQLSIKALQIQHSKSSVSQYVTISLGVATTIPWDQAFPEMLIDLADKALYQAKAEGRDRYILQQLTSDTV